uniref:Glycerophosphoryl diester phosphodiesterase n=1 Tax=uncultured bacterium contig00028 TaxID=1181517 RepID=A0A806K025_9BACT|nr:glycerophosphoryl diester phosphodiesterase [uncultured bacterium contig00028]
MPENTLYAFTRAVELGANGVELDIHLTKDGEIVVIHDERIDRVSNGTGMVKDYALQELKKFNFNKKQISEPKFMEIPTLREVLELLEPLKYININIEIKNNIVAYCLIEEKALALVREFGMLERILFSSFNHFSMQTVKNLEPNAKTALLCGGGIITTPQECLALGAKALNIDARGMRISGVIKEAATLGVEVNVWGIASTEDLSYANNTGVNAVIVNNIAHAKKAITLSDGILCWYPFDKNTDYIVVYEPEEISLLYLQSLHLRLNSNGRLLLIFENFFGVKEMLFAAGFKKQKWYYPLKDHRAAHEIFSENMPPNEFGNSYLVEALVSEKDESCKVDYARITLYRTSDKRFATVVNSDNTAKKIALHKDTKTRLKSLHENHKTLEELGIAVIPTTLEPNGNSVSMPRCAEPIITDYWLGKIKEGNLNEDEMFAVFDYIRNSIFKVFEKTKKCFWELVPANAFYNEEKKQAIFFDQEFASENMDPNVAVARAIHGLKYQPHLGKWNRTSVIYEKLQERYSIKENFEELLRIAHERTEYVFRP